MSSDEQATICGRYRPIVAGKPPQLPPLGNLAAALDNETGERCWLLEIPLSAVGDELACSYFMMGATEKTQRQANLTTFPQFVDRDESSFWLGFSAEQVSGRGSAAANGGEEELIGWARELAIVIEELQALGEVHGLISLSTITTGPGGGVRLWGAGVASLLDARELSRVARQVSASDELAFAPALLRGEPMDATSDLFGWAATVSSRWLRMPSRRAALKLKGHPSHAHWADMMRELLLACLSDPGAIGLSSAAQLVQRLDEISERARKLAGSSSLFDVPTGSKIQIGDIGQSHGAGGVADFTDEAHELVDEPSVSDGLLGFGDGDDADQSQMIRLSDLVADSDAPAIGGLRASGVPEVEASGGGAFSVASDASPAASSPGLSLELAPETTSPRKSPPSSESATESPLLLTEVARRPEHVGSTRTAPKRQPKADLRPLGIGLFVIVGGLAFWTMSKMGIELGNPKALVAELEAKFATLQGGSGPNADNGVNGPDEALEKDVVASAAATCPEHSAVVAPNVCMDRFEYPGPGVLPRTAITKNQASLLCQSRAGRLCRASEWMAACTSEPVEEKNCQLHEGGRKRPELRIADAENGCVRGHAWHDLIGNAAEWMEDGSVRGGDASSTPKRATCATRRKPDADTDRLVGFRCCYDREGVGADPAGVESTKSTKNAQHGKKQAE